jgi:hypothetical protein
VEPFQVVYKQIFISALRHFPNLSTDILRRERGQEMLFGRVKPDFYQRFLRGAYLLGFRTQKIISGLNDSSYIGMAERISPLLTPSLGECLKRRWGRPFSGAYKEFKCHLFLYRFSNQVELGTNPPALFIQQDLISTFLRSIPDGVVITPLTITISSLEMVPIAPISYTNSEAVTLGSHNTTLPHETLLSFT